MDTLYNSPTLEATSKSVYHSTSRARKAVEICGDVKSVNRELKKVSDANDNIHN